jgi:hypothetical protein
MPKLTVTVRFPSKQPTLAALERAIFKALQAAGRELLEQRVVIGARQRRYRP